MSCSGALAPDLHIQKGTHAGSLASDATAGAGRLSRRIGSRHMVFYQ